MNDDAAHTGQNLSAGVDSTRFCRDLVAGFDSTRFCRDLVAGFDSTHVARDVLAGLDFTKSYTDLVAGLDFTKSYTDLVAGLDTTQAVDDYMAGLDVAQEFSAIVSALQAAPGTEEALEELADRLKQANAVCKLSRATRYAIAVHAGFIAFLLFAWFYLVHPQAAKLMLDAATPASWACVIATQLYRYLDHFED